MSLQITLSALIGPLGLIAAGLYCLLVKKSGTRKALNLANAAAFANLASALFGSFYVASHGAISSGILGNSLAGFSIKLDALSCVMFCLVSFLGLIVTRYSQNYLDGDSRQNIFTGTLCLTLACVTALILSGHLLQFILAWIATSLALHKLLIFYKDRPAAVLSARKKFITARIGDICLISGSLLLLKFFGTGELAKIFEKSKSILDSGVSPAELQIAALLFAFAAALKSAQFPSHGWLAEVMETPTPVSALLHAGILNAGIFLMVRFSNILQFSHSAQYFLVIIGGFSALFASVVMLTQPSVKVSLAYSSAAHMGFMLMQCGFGTYPLAIAHLIGHSFYKAHAFLSAGSIIEYGGTGSKISASNKKSFAWILLSLLTSCAIYIAIGKLLSVQFYAHPAISALGIIFVMGITQLLIQSTRDKFQFAVAAKLTLSAILASLSFFTLEIISGRLLHPLLPEIPSSNSVMNFLIITATASFGVVVWFQFHLLTPKKSEFWEKAYVLIKNGFYTNTAFDQFADGLGLSKRKTRVIKTSNVSSPSFEQNLNNYSRSREFKYSVREALARAESKVAPLWPLKNFVAVNPFLGISSWTFEQAPKIMAEMAGAKTLMPKEFYRQALAENLIAETDIQSAIDDLSLKNRQFDFTVSEIKASLNSQNEISAAPVNTIADITSVLTRKDWARFAKERISFWAGSYFDQGQACWPSPWKKLGAYNAWLKEAYLDRSPEVMGIPNFRSWVKNLPEDPHEAIEMMVTRLGISQEGLENYFHRLLMSVGGWAAYVRFLRWERELYGQSDSTITHLLAIRLAWDLALFEILGKSIGISEAWEETRSHFIEPKDSQNNENPFAAILILQLAYEKAWQRKFLAKFSAPQKIETSQRKWLQGVFCIDVRSEVFRRSLESIDSGIETLGFAGFFGFPINYVPLGQNQAQAQCPVLLTPKQTIIETVNGADEKTIKKVTRMKLIHEKASKAWKSFKLSAVSCFAFVGPVGFAYFPKLITDSLKLTRPVPHPSTAGIPSKVIPSLGPSIEPERVEGQPCGFGAQERAAMAEQVLRAMSLTSDFAQIVLLTGHGSSTVNNPHASGLDCGACGGHSGESNARVAAAILNDPSVKKILAQKGISIPDDTFFLAALHDTTTDEVSVYDENKIPKSAQKEFLKLKKVLAEASKLTRSKRARLLNIQPGQNTDLKVIERSRDWSQVRPEWGLARCAAFIAAPRQRTSHLNLDGRAFLHSYDWKLDENFGVLELIMTAPMVVASWISLQYYGSTVDNQVWGSGNKVLHNVVGMLGVLEGNGGDLRTGLPLQSIHNGDQYVHEPLRLSVLIEAPIEAMNAVIEKNESVRQLVDNGWLHLFAMDEKGTVSNRYAGKLNWIPIAAAAPRG